LQGGIASADQLLDPLVQDLKIKFVVRQLLARRQFLPGVQASEDQRAARSYR
jgi:hypothetical protein